MKATTLGVDCSAAITKPTGRREGVAGRGRGVKKMYYIYTTDCYSVIKKDEIMPFAVTWMDLESVILNELSQTEKEKYHMTSLICEI